MGDAFGGKEFREVVPEIHLTRPPWRYSDDTVMARGLVEVLDRHGSMDQDELARIFATRYEADPYRGYGLTVRQVLERIHGVTPWNQSARAVFNGVGSMGNGGAMRVAPLGAYFADDLDETVKQARASAEVTHAHPEGQAGAIATAVAAALAWRARDQERPREGLALLRTVLEYTPSGATRAGLEKSLTLGFDRTVAEATHVFGQRQPDHRARYRPLRPLVRGASSRQLYGCSLGCGFGGGRQRYELRDRGWDRNPGERRRSHSTRLAASP